MKKKLAFKNTYFHFKSCGFHFPQDKCTASIITSIDYTEVVFNPNHLPESPRKL